MRPGSECNVLVSPIDFRIARQSRGIRDDRALRVCLLVLVADVLAFPQAIFKVTDKVLLELTSTSAMWRSRHSEESP